MSKELIEQLKTLRHERVKPAPEWLQQNRALLLAQIKNTVPVESQSQNSWENVWSWLAIFLPRDVVYNVVRPLAVLVIVALVGTSGWIASVDAAYDAIPGDGVAYFVKRGIEKTQVAVVTLVGGQDAQTKVHLKMAASRANEVRKMLVRTNMSEQVKRTTVAATVAELKQEISTVNKNIGEGGEKSKAQFVRDVVSDVKEIRAVLDDAKSNLSPSSTPELTKEVKAAKDLAKDASVRALEVLVNKHVAGDQTVSSAEVAKVVSTTLQAIVNEATASKEAAEDVKTIVETAKSELRDLTAAEPAMVGTGASTNKEITAKISATAIESSLVAETAKQVSDDVSRQATAAASALAGGDLVAAVGAIKDAAQVSKTVEQLTDSVSQQAQAVLPIVQGIKEAAATDAAASPAAATSSVASPSSSVNSAPAVSTTPAAATGTPRITP